MLKLTYPGSPLGISPCFSQVVGGNQAKHPLLVGGTVDGRNPAPVDTVNIPLFIGFHTSQVVQDFSHQQ